MSVSVCFDGFEIDPDCPYSGEYLEGNGYYPDEDSSFERAEVTNGYEPDAEQQSYWPDYSPDDDGEESYEVEPFPNRLRDDAPKPHIWMLERLEPQPIPEPIAPILRIDNPREDAIRLAVKAAVYAEDLASVMRREDVESSEIDLAIARVERAVKKIKKHVAAKKEAKKKQAAGVQLQLL